MYIHSKLIICSGYLVSYSIVYTRLGCIILCEKPQNLRVNRAVLYFLSTFLVHLRLVGLLNHVIHTWGPRLSELPPCRMSLVRVPGEGTWSIVVTLKGSLCIYPFICMQALLIQRVYISFNG